MVSTIVAGLVSLVGLGIYLKVSKWRENYKLAAKTGFPTYYCPMHLSDAWWFMLYPVLVPILNRLPKSWTNPWLPMAQIWRIWNAGHQPFEDIGSDSFILATPNGNIFWSCDNVVIHQLFDKWPKCAVPVDLVKFYDIWGPTIGSVEGDEWRAHRRVISAGFGTGINNTVWRETQRQTQTLAQHWVEKHNSTIPVIRHWTSRLALHIISSGFFNLRLSWDDNEAITKTEVNAQGTDHQIPFDQALFLMLEHLAMVFMTPRVLLDKLPIKIVKDANLGFTEVTKYLKELRASAESDVEQLANKRNLSLLEAIVVSGANPEIAGKKSLPEESVLGNLFFTLLAGHETTGSTMGFIFLLMAIYPDIQRKLQSQLDQQLGNRPLSEWTIEQDYQALQRGYLGAVQKETLYLYNPAAFLMRMVVEPLTVTDSQGRSHLIPANTFTPIPLAAAARNPAIWKKPNISSERRAALSDSPALYFDPDRWLGTDDRPDDINITNKANHPPTWYAFGQGQRSCPGRAFAQIEMTAAMATLFKGYSLELVVDDNVLQQCNGDSKVAWEKTRDKAIKMLFVDITSNISIMMAKELPIKISKRTS